MDIVEIVNENLPEGVRPISSLANPGEINRSVVAIIAEKIPGEQVGDMLREMLHATRPTKHGEIPDWRAREAAMKLFIAYREGLPVQRQEIHQTVTNRSEDENMRLLESPAVRSMLKKMLEQAEGVSEKQA
jgi:uncharacterized protein (DUF2336 family)